MARRRKAYRNASTPLAGATRALTRALDEMGAGRGRMFLLTGEPGIGKTRLCDELSALAGARGVPVLWGRAGGG